MYLEFFRSLCKEYKVKDDEEKLKEILKRNAELKCKNEFLFKEKVDSKKDRARISAEVEALKTKKATLLKEIKVYESEAKGFEVRLQKMKENLKETEETYKIAAKIVKDHVLELEQRGISKITRKINKEKVK